MANSKDRSMAGVLALVLVVLALLVTVAVSMAVGCGLGCEWGWLTWAAFLVACCVAIGIAIRRVARDERRDG